MSLLRSLGIVKVIRHKSRQWNQTNYYSLDCDRLAEYIKGEIAQSTETVEMWSTSLQGGENQTLKMENTSTSYIETKNTNQKNTAKQKDNRPFNEKLSTAAATSKKALKGEKSQTNINPHSERLTAVPGQKKRESEIKQSNPSKETKVAKVDYKINKELMALLDSTGIPINKTIKDLLKLYPSEKVEGAIALLKARKRDQHIPNLSGYFVAALKGDWASKTLTVEDSEDSEVDKGAVFRHWYDLAKELGYCSGQELRDGEQWICLSGSWEKWEKAIARGYSFHYLKKIMKRNMGQ